MTLMSFYKSIFSISTGNTHFEFKSARDNGLDFKLNNELAKFLGFKWDGCCAWVSEKEPPKDFNFIESKGDFLILADLSMPNMEIAIVSFNDKELARNEGFSWNKDSKRWMRISIEETPINKDFSFYDEHVIFIENLLKTKLFDYQKEGIKKMLSQRRFLNADDMGVGKSLQAISTSILSLEENKKVLIICPAFLKFNWQHEYEKHTKKQYKIKIISSKEVGKKSTFEDAQVFIINYDILHKLTFLDKNITIIICDEAHSLKATNNRRVNAFDNLIKEYQDRIVFLTGTPIKNRVPELYNFFRWCLKGTEPYNKFCSTYSYAILQNINGHKVLKFEGLKNERELRKRMISWYLRRETKDVLELPELQRIDVFSDVEKKKELEVFKALENAYNAFVNGEKSDHIMHVKKEASMLKCSDTVALANEILDNGESLVIFEHFVEPAMLIHSAIEGSCFIDGGTNMQKRQEYVEKFQNGDITCIVATIGALSTGVTLTKATKMIFNSLSWVPSDNMQAEKRIHRIGTTEKCVIYRILKTVFDVKIKNMLDRKEDVIERALQ